MSNTNPFANLADVTDPGFHLANQQMVGRIGLLYIIEQPYWWFSDELINNPIQLLAHSRNFGSFAATPTGLLEARGTL